MADLSLDVDLRGPKQMQEALRDLEAQFTRTAKSARDSAAVFTRSSEQQTVATRTSNGAMAKSTKDWLQGERRRLAMMQESERMMQRQAQEEIKAAQEIARAKQQQAQREDFLRQKYDESYRAMVIYRSQVMELNEALQLGAVSQSQYAQQIDNLNEQLAAGTITMNNYNNQAVGGLNRFGMVTQQVGYQVGDFLVQVQSGTNAFVAFGQQATQLAGLLTLIPGYLGLGVALSILIPLTTAVGAAFMRTGKEAKTTTSLIDNLESSVRKYISSAKDAEMSTEELVQRFGKVSGAAREALRNISSLNLAKVFEGFDEQLDDSDSSINRLRRILTEFSSPVVQSAGGEGIRSRLLGNLAEEFRLTAEQASVVVSRFNDLVAAQTNLDRVAAAQNLSREILAVYGAVENIPPELQKVFDLANRTVLAAGELETATDDAGGSVDSMNTKLERTLGLVRGILGEIQSIEFDTVAKQAEVAALRAGMTPGMAAIQGKAAGTSAQLGAEGVDPVIIAATTGLQKAALEQNLKIDEERQKLLDAFNQKTKGGGGSSGIEGLIGQLQTERETLEAWYTESQELLMNATNAELEIIGGSNEARLRLEQEYQDRLKGIRSASTAQTLQDTANLFGALAGIASAGGQKMVKVVATFQAIEGTINAYGAAIKALNTPGISLAGRFAAYASVLAAGLKGVAAIRSAGGGGGGGGGSPGTSTVAPSAGAPSPQTVFIDSITPDSLYSGQTLINLFDSFYNENDKRGKVFVVAR